MTTQASFDIDSFSKKITQPRFCKKTLVAQINDKALLIQRYVQSTFYKELFEAKILPQVSDYADNHAGLKVGQLVTFTNDNGVSYVNHEILGFDLDPTIKNNRHVFLNYDCYWFAARVDSITVQDGLIGLDDTDLAKITPEYENCFLPWDLKIIRAKLAVSAD